MSRIRSIEIVDFAFGVRNLERRGYGQMVSFKLGSFDHGRAGTPPARSTGRPSPS
jgi:hypothetical protein